MGFGIPKFITNTVSKAVEVTKDVASNAVDGAKGLVNGVVETAKDAGATVAHVAKDTFEGAKDIAVDVAKIPVDVAKNVISGDPGKIASDLWGDVKDLGGDVKDLGTNVAKDALNGAKELGKDVLQTGLDAVLKPAAGTILDVLDDVVPVSGDDKKNDGLLVDSSGKTYPAGTPVSQVGAGAKPGQPTVIEINGVSNTVDQQKGAINDVANATGANVIGVHNSTEGLVRDVIQSGLDKLQKGDNPAVDSLANTVYDEMKAGREVHLIAHSQGALVTSNALTQVKQRLMVEDGLSKEQAEQKLSALKVETFGGAAWTYPDGPQYVHYVNSKDLIPQALGTGSGWHLGEGAVVRKFENPKDAHSLNDTYLPQRVPFDEARRGDFSHPGAHAL